MMNKVIRLRDYLKCTHENRIKTYQFSYPCWTDDDKHRVTEVQEQCLTCGKPVGDRAEYAFTDEFDVSTLTCFDFRFWVDMQKKNDPKLWTKKEKEADDWWWRYNDYLKTDKWHKKRIKVLARDKVCQACLDRPAVQVHHTTYKHVGNEPLFELVGVCVPCHDCITQLDRADKNTR
jgi:hypothetical protein